MALLLLFSTPLMLIVLASLYMFMNTLHDAWTERQAWAFEVWNLLATFLILVHHLHLLHFLFCRKQMVNFWSCFPVLFVVMKSTSYPKFYFHFDAAQIENSNLGRKYVISWQSRPSKWNAFSGSIWLEKAGTFGAHLFSFLNDLLLRQ